uniref:Uncharacterized protein n=1 Tax=Glossina pallidipes TaxID=7398 RepID=A0A1A9ZEZ4_GLOPL
MRTITKPITKRPSNEHISNIYYLLIALIAHKVRKYPFEFSSVFWNVASYEIIAPVANAAAADKKKVVSKGEAKCLLNFQSLHLLYSPTSPLWD